MKCMGDETCRRDSDSFDALEDFRQSQLERNCGQIFVKGPAMTKDFLEKMNTEIVPKKTYLFGYELNTKKILFISGLFLLFFTSLFGAMVMWFTDFFDNAILSTMVISNSSKYFDLWARPSPRTLVSVHIFNYTNLDEVENSMDKKLRVQELGPYVYEEAMERVNIKFDDLGNTVSYQESKSYKFRADLSKGRQSDQVTVPNIPVIGGTAITKYQSYFIRMGFSSVLTGIDEKPFVTLPAHNFTIGYRNRLVDLKHSWGWLFDNGKNRMAEKMGLLAPKVGVQPYVITMNTGKNNIDDMRLIEKLDDQDHLDFWSTEECNRIAAADGALFPPKQIQRKERVNYLIPQMCRTLPLVFEKEVNILNNKIPAYKYAAPDEVFDSAEGTPENQCYCSMNSGDCPLKGVFNITPCSFGLPMFVSQPHFYGADEVLFNGVDGLKTLEKKDVETYLNLHPTMGFAMSGRATFQLNIQIQKAYGIHQMDKYEEGLILPIAWVSVELKENTLPQDFLDVIYESTYTLKGVKIAFKYGFLLTTLITLICIVLVLWTAWEKPNRVGVVLRDHQRHMPEVHTVIV